MATSEIYDLDLVMDNPHWIFNWLVACRRRKVRSMSVMITDGSEVELSPSVKYSNRPTLRFLCMHRQWDIVSTHRDRFPTDIKEKIRLCDATMALIAICRDLASTQRCAELKFDWNLVAFVEIH